MYKKLTLYFAFVTLALMSGLSPTWAQTKDKGPKKIVNSKDEKSLLGGDIGIPQNRANSDEEKKLLGGDIGIPQKTGAKKAGKSKK